MKVVPPLPSSAAPPGLSGEREGLPENVTWTSPRHVETTPLTPNTGEPRSPSGPITITDPGGGSSAPRAMTGKLQSRMGRYLIRGELGRGGMGVVFLAWDPLLKRDVALKVLRDAYLAEDTVRRRMLREATAVARVRHPSVVEIYDFGEEAGHIYFTMRLVPGESLAQRLKKGPVAPRAAATIAASIARALQHAHDLGLVHRDVKPGNILLDTSDKAVLTDFGLVKETDSEDMALTRDTQVLGTPAYMAPEQVREGARRALPASDQYALGVVLYQMLKGWPPYYGATPMEIWRRILKEEPPPLSGPELPPELIAITQKAMAREPQDRYPSVGALAEDLERFLAGERVVATLPSLKRKIQQELRRHRARLGSALVILLVFLVATLGRSLWDRAWDGREARQREREAEERRIALNARIAELEAAGATARTDELFSNYVGFEANAETVALARAWLDQGARLEQRGDVEGGQRARATAYAMGSDPEVQTEALLGLGRSYYAQEDWDSLSQALQVIVQSGAEARSPTEVQRWRRDLAFHDHEVDAALALTTDPEERAAIRSLAQVTATPYKSGTAIWADLEGDGVREILLTQDLQGPYVAVAPREALPILRNLSGDGALKVDDGRVLYPIGPDLSPPFLLQQLQQNEQRCLVLGVAEAGLHEIGSLDCEGVRDAVNVDLDEDGQPEVYVSDNRRLTRLISDEDGYRLVSANDETSGANSEIWHMVAEDLDGDGRRELAVATSGWGAYDVRILRPGSGGQLDLVSRLRLGENIGMTFLPTKRGPSLAVAQRHDPHTPLNVQVFGPSTPHGAARGVHLLSFDGKQLNAVQVTPTRGLPHVSDTRQITADLDGDGDQDLVLRSSYQGTTLLLARPDGAFTSLSLGAVVPLLGGNMDSDPADELLVRDREMRIWALGMGTDPWPDLARSAPPSGAPVPETIPKSMVAAWERAENLVALGLSAIASDHLLKLSELAPGSITGIEARLRAAHLLEASGDAGGAAELFVQAAAEADPLDVTLASSAWDDAFRCFLLDRRFDEALAAGRARLRLPDPGQDLVTRVSALERDLAGEPVRLNLVQGIPPSVQLLTPLGPRWSSSTGGLNLRAVGEERLLRIPVRPTGGPVSIELTLELNRLDWGTRLMMSRTLFQGDLAPSTLISLIAGGGGGLTEEVLSCPDQREILHKLPSGSGRGSPITISREMARDGSGGTCGYSDGGAMTTRSVSLDGMAGWAEPDAPFWLSLDTFSQDTVMDITVKSITLEGLELVAVPEDPLAAVHQRIVMGDPEGALPLLRSLGAGAGEREVALATAIASDAAGAQGTSEALRRLLASGAQGKQDALALLILLPERFGPRLREQLGQRWYAHAALGLRTLIAMQRDNTSVQTLLTTQLEGLEDLTLSPKAPLDEQIAVIELLVARGAAWLAQGRPGLAERDLAHAIELGAALEKRVRDEPVAHLAWGRAYAAAFQVRARLSYEAGDEAGALADLDRGLAVHPSPQTFADVLSVWQPLAGLRASPGWAHVQAARTASGS